MWQGNKYAAYPISAEGFEYSGKGALPRPTLTVANITSLISGVIESYDGLIGAKVIRKKTFAKYLDSYCYTDGYPVSGVCSGESGGDPSLSKSDCLDSTKNGSAGTWTTYTQSSCEAATGPGIWYDNFLEDSTAQYPDEIWYVDRKALETNTHIQFELTAAYDVQGVQLPGRTIIANMCPWVYKGVECGYAGSSYWDYNNNSVANSTQDVCSKSFTSCELRFDENTESPFGGFPGAGIRMGSLGA